MAFLKKELGSVNKFFRKNGSGEKFLKKVGSEVGKVGAGVSQASNVLGKGVSQASNILGKVEKSPLGMELMPVTGALRTGLGVLGGVSRVGQIGGGALSNISKAKNVSQGVVGGLEASKKIMEEGKGIKFM